MRKGFNQFRNQIGVAIENISVSKTCFTCYEGDIKASITVYNGGAFDISVDVPNRLKRSLTFKSMDDFDKRSEFYYDAEGVAWCLLQSCLMAENVCNESNLPIPKSYTLEVRACLSQALFTYDLV